MSIKASIRSAGTKVTANTVGIIPVLNGNTTLNGSLSINGNLTTSNLLTASTIDGGLGNNLVISSTQGPSGGGGMTLSCDSLSLSGTTVTLNENQLAIGSASANAINITSTYTGTGDIFNVNAETDTVSTTGNLNVGSYSSTYSTYALSVNAITDAVTMTGNLTAFGAITAQNSLSTGGNASFAGNLGVDGNNFYVNATTHRVGIGTSQPNELLEVKGNIIGDSLTLIDSPTGGELRVRSAGTDAQPSYDNIRIEGSDSILKAGQFKVHKVVYDTTGQQEIQNNYQFSYTAGSTDVYTFNNLSHGDGTAAGPLRIDAKGASAAFNLEGVGGYGSAASIATIKAHDGAAELIVHGTGTGRPSIETKTDGGTIFKTTADSDTHETGTIKLGTSGFQIARTFDGASYSHSITGTNLTIAGTLTTAAQPNITSVGTLNSPMTTGAITVTRAGATYANAPRLDLIDSDGTNQRCSVINSGGNLQLEARNGTGKGIISFIQNTNGVRTTAMKISSGGKVGIGLEPDNNVLEDFHVGGNGRIDGDFFGNIGSNTFTVKSSTNNVGIGTSAPPAGYKLAVVGDSRFTGSGIFGATATGGNKGLQKHYTYTDAGAFRLYRTNSATNSITMKYQSTSSNEFVIAQTGSSSDVLKFQTDTTKFISNVEIGGNGNAKALMIRDGRDSTDGIRFTHTGVNDEVQMGMYGSYGHVDQGRFKITHKNSSDANTTVLQIEKNGTQLQILKPTLITGQLNLGTSVPVYSTNSAAKAGGLVNGDVYRNSTGQLFIVYT